MTSVFRLNVGRRRPKNCMDLIAVNVENRGAERAKDYGGQRG